MAIKWDTPTTSSGIKWDTPSQVPEQSLSDSLWSKLGQAKGIGQKFDTLLQAGANATQNIPGAKVGSALGTQVGGLLAGENLQQINSQIKPEQVLADSANAMFTAGSMAVPIAKGLPLQVAGGAGMGAVQGALNAEATGGNVKDEATTGAIIGASIPVAFKTAGIVSGWLGSILKGTAGVATGTGTDVINQILTTPKSALKGMKSDTLKGLVDDTKNIRNQIAGLKTASTENYSKALESLPGGYQEAKLATGLKVNPADFGKLGGEVTPTGTFIADVNGTKVALTMKGVKDKLTSLLKTKGAKIVNGQPDFFETSLKNAEQSVLSQVWSDVKNWTDTSPKGLDKLATKINAYIKKGETSPQLNGILSELSQNTRKYIGERIPGAKPMVDQFIQEHKFIDELQAYLGKVNNPNDAVGIKSTMAKIQTLFTKNKDMARGVLDGLTGGSDILGKQAGREVATQIPRSIATIGDLTRGVLNTVIPPKFVGELVAYTGMALEKAQPIVNALQKLQPAERVILIESMLGQNKEVPQ
jgi:hypothetical protein